MTHLHSLRVVFMGTPDFSVGALTALVDAGFDVVAVYSQPPRPKGRGQQVQPSPVHAKAQELGIPVFTPLNFKSPDDVAQFAKHQADVAVVAAYGLILPVSILNTPRYGCINIHASLLPRWRGAAPIQRAILAGDDKSGVTIMQMEKGLDTGPMIAIEEIAITSDTTATSLHDDLSCTGARMIVKVLQDLQRDGHLVKTVQPEEGVTYASMLTKDEGRIDWTRSANEIDRQVRAFTPWPGTWTLDQEQKRFKILSVSMKSKTTVQVAGSVLDNTGAVACGDGQVIQIETLQPESKKAMRFEEALRGGYISVGSVFVC